MRAHTRTSTNASRETGQSHLPLYIDTFDRSICATISGMMCGMTATVDELVQAAVDARRVAQNAISVAVREARAADWSWDRISTALGGSPNGETLRRNFGSNE